MESDHARDNMLNTTLELISHIVQITILNARRLRWNGEDCQTENQHSPKSKSLFVKAAKLLDCAESHKNLCSISTVFMAVLSLHFEVIVGRLNSLKSTCWNICPLLLPKCPRGSVRFSSWRYLSRAQVACANAGEEFVWATFVGVEAAWLCATVASSRFTLFSGFVHKTFATFGHRRKFPEDCAPLSYPRKRPVLSCFLRWKSFWGQ